MGFETQRHRGTQRSGVVATQSCQGASKALEVHPEGASTGKSRVPQGPLLHTWVTPNTQRSSENCP
jgi:hypothetical protein